MLLVFTRKIGRPPRSRTVPTPPQTECAAETLVTENGGGSRNRIGHYCVSSSHDTEFTNPPENDGRPALGRPMPTRDFYSPYMGVSARSVTLLLANLARRQGIAPCR